MDSRGIRRVVSITSLLDSSIATAGQERDLRKRLTSAVERRWFEQFMSLPVTRRIGQTVWSS